jgi:hypothetical protein
MACREGKEEYGTRKILFYETLRVSLICVYPGVKNGSQKIE